MSQPFARWTALALACLLAVGCKDKREPVKPTTAVITAAVICLPGLN